MDTHLTLLNPSVVRERELAYEHIHDRFHDTGSESEEVRSDRLRERQGRVADLVASSLFLTLFSGLLVLLAAGFR